MDPATPTGETPGTTDPKTNAIPAVTPTVNTPDPAVEELRKKAEQAEMRANQLQNQLKAKEDADAAAAAAKLVEQNEYKTLYEQTQAKLTEAQTAQAQAEKATALKVETDKLFADYPDEVRNLAKDVGLTLTDTDEDTTTAFKEKLDKISGSIKAPKVTPNNPGNPTVPTEAEMSPQELQALMRDPVKFQAYLDKNYKGISNMKQRPA